MTITAPPPPAPPSPIPEPGPEDVPRTIDRSESGPDRVFSGVLAGSSAVVLAMLVGTVGFLCYYGWPALKEAGLSIFGTVWSPDSGHFGMMSFLIGSIAIALIGVAIATPVSLATGLMINEYAPKKMKPLLTGVIDLLATVPSIVYGFWGLELISPLQAAPAKWAATYLGFVPILRTPSPGQYVKSIMACGLICAVTIIPIITSISREVMAQTPEDVCEAALGLGGTRWGMVTNVIFPFSKDGILGAVLLGIGRGLGETMIVVLVLSSGNHVTSALLGPGGLGSIAQQITDNFEAQSSIYKSGLILMGLLLFMTTLLVNIIARLIVRRSAAYAS
jgi:phosphate transport system permease protein